jgi:hypothetical protein
MADVARVPNEDIGKRLCPVLTDWFGGRWRVEEDTTAGDFVLHGTGIMDRSVDRAHYLVVGYLIGWRKERPCSI